MNPALIPWDFALRGAAAGLLLFHVVHVLTSAVPRAHRWSLAAFCLSVLAYVVCSHPDFADMPAALWLLALSFCLMSAPLLWLAIQVIFKDHFSWSATTGLVMAATFALGWLAVGRISGISVNILHKAVLIGFAAATLWTTLKDWQSDLVSKRRVLRAWVAASLGVYVLLVLGFELALVGSKAPVWLEMLNLGGIVLLTGALALVVARHPLEAWLWQVTSQAPLPHASPVTPELAAPVPPSVFASGTLTPPPPVLDRKTLLRERLLQAMGEARAYAQEGLTVAQLAARLDANEAQLRDTINQQLGYRNFNDFLHRYRVDEAAQRLLRQDLPILSIALDVGYGSIGPFNRAFKHIKGVTPSEFRAQQRPV